MLWFDRFFTPCHFFNPKSKKVTFYLRKKKKKKKKKLKKKKEYKLK